MSNLEIVFWTLTGVVVARLVIIPAVDRLATKLADRKWRLR